jgi:integrase
MVYPRGRGKLVKQKNGNVRRERKWWYRFRFAGRWIHESSKSTSKEVARDAERQRHRQLEESWNRITKRTLPPTFEKAAAEWLKGREGRVSDSTLTIGRVAVGHLMPVFGEKLLCDIAPKAVEAYQQARLREGAQGRTVNIEVQALRQIVKANKCWQHLDGEVHSLKERKGIGKALAPEEESRLLEECAKADSACYTAVTLALNTTMRKSEIRLLRWGQVELFDRILTVGKSKTDAGEGRTIPLNAAAVKALADWATHFPNRQPEHYVFPKAEGNTPPDPTRPAKGWRTAWRNACKRAGLSVRFHDLRHTAITKLAEGQASDQTIMSIAGHVSRQMLEHYSHIRIAAKRAALDAISTRLPEPANLETQARFPQGVNQNVNQIGMLQNEAVSKLLN